MDKEDSQEKEEEIEKPSYTYWKRESDMKQSTKDLFHHKQIKK